MKKSRCRYRTLLAGFVSALLLAVSANATLTVNSNADAGGTCPGATCTLRQAIATAVSGDTITFAAGITTITLTSNILFIDKHLTINGPGANLLTVQRSDAADAANFRIFFIGGVNVTISGLTIANGADVTGSGGGISNGGMLTIANCTISGNSANVGAGGGISNSGTLNIIDSTISGNSANSPNDINPGNGGGISNHGNLTITNSTISGNTAVKDGGGIANAVAQSVTIINSTISGNTAVKGGGILNDTNGTVRVKNTIIAQNTVTVGGTSPDFSGVLTSQGYNLIGNTSGTIISGVTGTTTGNQLDVDPKLDPTLRDNGGPTFTHALLASSPAIDKGHSSGSTMDQRGFSRPVDTPAILNGPGDGSDIGAYEVPADQLPGCSSTVVTNTNDDGAGSLRFTIVGACIGSTITFAPNVTGAINLVIGQLLIDKNLTINGPGANLLSVRRNAAAGNFRIFDIPSGSVIANISGLTIANGNTAAQPGGGISNSGRLTLTNVTVSDNFALGTGGFSFTYGGGINNGGTLTLINATISGNTSNNGGGIYSSGMVTINNSTISGNTVSSNVNSGAGGGILTQGGTVTLTNSTVSGNMAIGPAGKSFDSGGGILNVGGTVTLTSSTISSNAADKGGGILTASGGTVTSKNTIVALNTSPAGPDINGTLTSEGFNLIGSNSGANITPSAFPDQIGVTAEEVNLGPLQDNGGPTQTQAPLPGSRAIDKGDSSGLSTDQRGFPRPSDFPAIPNGSGSDGADTGAFEVQAPTPTPAPGLVGNVSTRLPVGTGDNALFGGFIVQGPAGSTKEIMVRAIGPSLLPFGVNDALANPTLEIRDGSNAIVATNDDWKNTQVGGLIGGDQFPEINGSGLAPSDDLESAIIADLAPGSYTAIVRGFGDTSGTGVVDAYDLSAASPARLANVATRGLIQPGDKLMIAGFIIQNGEVRAVVRAIGPSLSAFGINNALPDTTLELRDQNGMLVRANDDWESDQKQALENSGLQPSDPKEAAILVTLQPGQYTVQVRGKPETTGIGVVQVYFLQ